MLAGTYSRTKRVPRVSCAFEISRSLVMFVDHRSLLRASCFFSMIRRPHHLGERRVKKTLKLLIMIHHDFVSVMYCFYEWFSRPQRVALLLCGLVSLMAVEATVFATIMFKVKHATVLVVLATNILGAELVYRKSVLYVPNGTCHLVRFLLSHA